MLTTKRKREPAHYMLKIESFSLLSEAKTDKVESDVFEASGHKWRLDLYPSGNEEENGGNHISLYLVICDTESSSKGWEVCVDVKFFVYDHRHHMYATFQDLDGNATRFHEKKLVWGLDRLISLESFKDIKNGYLFNDSCVFGAEVFAVPDYTEKDRCLSMIKPPATMNTHTWRIPKFSAVSENVLYSDIFKVGKVKWKLSLYPKGNQKGKDSYLSMYLGIHNTSSLPVGWRVYAQFKLRVKNQFGNADVEKAFEQWFCHKAYDWGSPRTMLLSELNDLGLGYLLDDNLIVEAEISYVDTLKNFM